MSTSLKQATLQFSPSGEIAVSHVAARNTSSTPSPTFRRQPIREAYVDPKKPKEGLDGARSDGEDVSADEDEDNIALLPSAPGPDSEEGEDTAMNDDQGSSSSDESELKVVRPSSATRHGRVPTIAISDEDDAAEEAAIKPQASTSARRLTPPPAPKPLASAPVSPLHRTDRRSRSVSVFDGVVIYTTPKKPSAKHSAPSAKNATPGPSRLQNGAQAAGTAPSDDESDDEPVHLSQRTGAGKGAGKKRAAPSSSSSAASSASSPSDSDDELPVPASIARDNKRLASKREQRLQDAALRSSASKGKSQGKRATVDTKRRLAALSQGQKDRRSADEESEEDFVVDDEVVQYDTSEDDEGGGRKRVKKGKGAGKGKGKARTEDGSGGESDEPVRRLSHKKEKKRDADKKRAEVQRELLATDSDATDVDSKKKSASSSRKSKGEGKATTTSGKRKKRRRVASDDDVDDEPDDLEILDEETVREEKFRARKDPSSRYAQLKAAREKRAAKNTLVISDSEDQAQLSRAQSHAKKARPRYLGAAQEESSASESDSEVSESCSLAQTDLSENLEGFIVEAEPNEGDRVVDEWRESVRGQAQGLKFYVKQYLAYLVYLIVDPNCDWLAADNEWKDAHRRVHGQLDSLLNSLISSQAWKPKFRHAIDTRPEWYREELSAEERGGPCDACMQGAARHSTWSATISGPKYDRKTLRPNLAEDDSSNSDDVDSEDEGRPLEEKTYEFALGSQCAGRAEVYHELRHWAYHTRERLLDKLAPHRRALEPPPDDPGLSREQRRVEREKAANRRAKEAGRLVELLERRQVMGSFASKLVDEIERAHSSFAK